MIKLASEKSLNRGICPVMNINYCSQNNLNRRVIRKMIEFSINTPFESERELVNHESFKSLEKVSDEPEKVG